jgi:VanZ family protein
MPPRNAKLFTLLIGLVIVGAIASANLGFGDTLSRWIQRVPGRDLTGHLVLFGGLSLGASAWLADPRRQRAWTHRAVAVLLAALVTLEELSQIWIPGRTFSLADLSASLLGVAAGAAAAAVLARWLRRA